MTVSSDFREALVLDIVCIVTVLCLGVSLTISFNGKVWIAFVRLGSGVTIFVKLIMGVAIDSVILVDSGAERLLIVLGLGVGA